MSDWSPISARRLAQFKRRAATLQAKAEDLLSAMIEEVGEDSLETDFADAVVERAEELGDMLDRWSANRTQTHEQSNG